MELSWGKQPVSDCSNGTINNLQITAQMESNN